jgi:hypothetical protein
LDELFTKTVRIVAPVPKAALESVGGGTKGTLSTAGAAGWDCDACVSGDDPVHPAVNPAARIRMQPITAITDVVLMIFSCWIKVLSQRFDKSVVE